MVIKYDQAVLMAGQILGDWQHFADGGVGLWALSYEVGRWDKLFVLKLKIHLQAGSNPGKLHLSIVAWKAYLLGRLASGSKLA